MGNTTETDYVEIKKYYILNPTVSNKAIADKFKVSYPALRKRISSHNWSRDRNDHYGDMEADFREASKARDLIERDELDTRLKRNNELILKQVEKKLSKVGDRGVATKELRALTDIQRSVHESEYRRLNVPMPKQPIEVTPAMLPPGEAVELPELDIEGKIETVQYTEMKSLPAPDDDGGGNGSE